MNIEPIKLLSGSHADTGETGHGCFMNVIAYLNGEPQITDESPCVCVTVRRPAVWLNDYMNDTERQQLLPFIMRAMGSATDDKAEMSRRLKLLVEMANDYRGIAKCYSKDVAEYADAAAAAAAAAYAYADAYAAAYAYADAYAAAYADADAAADVAVAAHAYADAATYAAAYAAVYAYAAADVAARKEIIARMLRYLDEALPPANEPQQMHIERVQRLIELAGV
jgi:hypothetical protein